VCVQRFMKRVALKREGTKLLAALRQDRAAGAIQARWHRHVARRVRAAVTIARVWRGSVGRARAGGRRAAVKAARFAATVQAMWRGKRGREMYARAREEAAVQKCARKLQSIFRGMRARRAAAARLVRMRMRRPHEENLTKVCACVCVCVWECVRACVRVCVCVCGSGGGGLCVGV
jgi:hypothetical protein